LLLSFGACFLLLQAQAKGEAKVLVLLFFFLLFVFLVITKLAFEVGLGNPSTPFLFIS
jgi:hypothetical protein